MHSGVVAFHFLVFLFVCAVLHDFPARTSACSFCRTIPQLYCTCMPRVLLLVLYNGCVFSFSDCQVAGIVCFLAANLACAHLPAEEQWRLATAVIANGSKLPTSQICDNTFLSITEQKAATQPHRDHVQVLETQHCVVLGAEHEATRQGTERRAEFRQSGKGDRRRAAARSSQGKPRQDASAARKAQALEQQGT